MTKRLLIIFVKKPQLGKCKTRLAKTVGDEKALTFYKNMLSKTAQIIPSVEADVAIFYSDFIDKNDIFSGEDVQKFVQKQHDDLGERMADAFQQMFKLGYQSVCIMGTDCYSLDATTLNTAFQLLQTNDAVLGPSNDGGYYLLGMNKMYASLFRDKVWSTESVAQDTINDFKSMELKFELLQQLVDIDTEDDLISIPKNEWEALLERSAVK